MLDGRLFDFCCRFLLLDRVQVTACKNFISEMTSDVSSKCKPLGIH